MKRDQRHVRRLILGLTIILVLTGQAPGVAWGQDVVVSPVPILQSPRILDGRVYAIAEVGNKIVVGGTFTTVRDWNSSTSITRNRILAFDKSTGLIDPAFAPSLDDDVQSLVASPDGQSAYVGGAFTNIDGVPRSRLARLSLADGHIDPLFAARADKRITDMALSGGKLIVGGWFTKLSGVSRGLLGAVDASTGTVLDSLNLPVGNSRDTSFPYIQELDVSPDGRWLAIAGNFLRVGALDREQLALIDLASAPASVADWATQRYHNDCASIFNDTYMRDVAFSPDSSFLVVVTTGGFVANTTLCDTASRWEVAQTGSSLQPTWVTYTGGDTHWHALVTEAAVYVGGHQRWENNPNPTPRGNNDGPGAVSRPGIAALDPLTGVPLSWNPGRARGRGVEAFLATEDYLYVGSDTNLFNGYARHRLAVLPAAGGVPNPPPDDLSLPVDLFLPHSDRSLYHSTFDGQAATVPSAVSGPGIDGIDWSALRDGWIQHGQLFYFGPAGAYYKRTFDGASFGPVTNLSTTVGYVDTDYNVTPYDQPYNVDTTRAVAYDQGRLYYTRSNDSRLFWRWFALESGIVGAQEYVASGANWTGVNGLEIAGNWLYASWSDDRLYRAHVSAPSVDASSLTLVDDGAVSGIPWYQARGLLFDPAAGPGYEPPPPPPTPEVTCPLGQWKAEYFFGTQLAGSPETARCEPA
ncbi:MAG: delta-60 repeat domain-containing protein, partial [Gaiellales bacterium]